MFNISTLNKISKAGLNCFNDSYQIIEDVNKANGILVRSHDMRDMEFSDDLLAIARAGAGVNNIPLERCTELGIVVFNAPGANANAVKELVIASLLMAARNISTALSWTKTIQTDVSRTVEKNKSQFAGKEIKDKTLGVVGLGAIGGLVANACNSLGMKVLGYDPYLSIKSAHNLSDEVILCEKIDDMLKNCDYVTIHIPFTNENKGLFNAERFAIMKPEACLLNFSRDSIVSDADLLEALRSSKLRLYVTDFPNDAVINEENVICVPHLGASTEEAEDNCAIMASKELIEYLENGNIRNSVNFPQINIGNSNLPRILLLHRNTEDAYNLINSVILDLKLSPKTLHRREKNGSAATLMELDAGFDKNALMKALENENIFRVRILNV